MICSQEAFLALLLLLASSHLVQAVEVLLVVREMELFEALFLLTNREVWNWGHFFHLAVGESVVLSLYQELLVVDVLLEEVRQALHQVEKHLHVLDLTLSVFIFSFLFTIVEKDLTLLLKFLLIFNLILNSSLFFGLCLYFFFRISGAPFERSINQPIIPLDFLRRQVRPALFIFKQSHHIISLLSRYLLQILAHLVKIPFRLYVQIDCSFMFTIMLIPHLHERPHQAFFEMSLEIEPMGSLENFVFAAIESVDGFLQKGRTVVMVGE